MRINLKYISIMALTSCLITLTTAHAAPAPSADELQRRIDSLERRLNATADMVEQARPAGERHGSGGRTTVGGYGELHYNNLDSKKEIDLHRFILFLGHEFSDRIRFWSETEIEHLLVTKDGPGEVELEQAYLEFDLNEHHRARTGVILVPVGILNETHEPPTFYGVERNPVEKNIIPTTWWEGGASLNGQLAPGWSYDLMLSSGLLVDNASDDVSDPDPQDDYLVRGGRQKVAEARADNLATTVRIKWTGIPGLELSASTQVQDDVAQGQESQAVDATLFETHVVYNQGPATVKALYAAWDLDGTGPGALGRDKQEGWYVEPSYKVTDKFGIFARYNEWDNEAGSAADTTREQTDIGINYWPHPDVVLKADLMDQGGAASDEGFNLGVGYQF